MATELETLIVMKIYKIGNKKAFEIVLMTVKQ